MYNVLKNNSGSLSIHEITRIHGTMGTHTLENSSKAQTTLIVSKYILRDRIEDYNTLQNERKN
jgi:hypothetical protein